MNYLPSKKLLFVLLALLASAGTIWIAGKKIPLDTSHKDGGARGNLSSPPNAQDTDSDGDGTPDWEEVLVGLDPENPDTQAYASGAGALREYDDASSLGNQISPTASLLIDLAQYIRSGGDVNAVDTGAVAEKLANAALEASKNKKIFASADIHIDPKETVKNYLNNVGAALKKNFPEDPHAQNYKSEITVVTELLQIAKRPEVSQAEIALAGLKLLPFQKKYSAVTSDLSTIRTPPEAVDIQIDFLNSFSAVADSLGHMASIASDPITGVLGSINYDLEREKIKPMLQKVKELVKTENIVFAPQENGYILQTYIDRI